MNFHLKWCVLVPYKAMSGIFVLSVAISRKYAERKYVELPSEEVFGGRCDVGNLHS